MALNIKDPQTEALAAEVAALAEETKTRAVRIALEERRARLLASSGPARRRDRLRLLLEDEIWRIIPAEALGRPLERREREEILGYGPEGV